MTHWTYTCPDCGALVRIDHPSVQLHEIKVCACDSAPVEAVEEAS